MAQPLHQPRAQLSREPFTQEILALIIFLSQGKVSSCRNLPWVVGRTGILELTLGERKEFCSPLFIAETLLFPWDLSLVFLPALLPLPGQWGGLGYPNLSQFVNLPPRGQPHLQQQSLGKGWKEPPDRIQFLVLTSREAGESW